MDERANEAAASKSEACSPDNNKSEDLTLSGAKLTVEERRRRRLEFEAWRDAHGPTLGPDLTIKQLINEGRR